MSTQPTIHIFDTTLRDGTQAEGISFPVPTKIRIAEKLDQFGVDYIEGGWPGSNPRDMSFFEAVKEMHFKHAKMVAFGSTRRAKNAVEDDPQVQLLIDAQTPVVSIFGKSWLLHVNEVLRVSPEDNLAMIEDTVRYLKAAGKELIYDAEHFFDGYRNDPDYALATLEAAIRGGADNVSLCDTNGGILVSEATTIARTVIDRFPGTSVGIHAHNDSGLGVAVALACVEAGANLVQGTINGIGERVGNANLTTIIPNLALKAGLSMNCSQHLSSLRDLSLFLDEMANVNSNSKEPYVGASAFAHKGGIHADAAAKVKSSYEHIEPERVGNRTRVLVSDLSGRASLLMKAREVGFDLEKHPDALKDFLAELKELEFRGYEFEAADASFKLLLYRFLKGWVSPFDLQGYRVSSSRQTSLGRVVSEATVKVTIGGQVVHTVAESTGPVGALDHALRKALGSHFPAIESVRLVDYHVRILEGKQGADAITRVFIESTNGKEIWGTVGASDNIINASWQALRDSMEYILLNEEESQQAATGG